MKRADVAESLQCLLLYCLRMMPCIRKPSTVQNFNKTQTIESVTGELVGKDLRVNVYQ